MPISESIGIYEGITWSVFENTKGDLYYFFLSWLEGDGDLALFLLVFFNYLEETFAFLENCEDGFAFWLVMV